MCVEEHLVWSLCQNTNNGNIANFVGLGKNQIVKNEWGYEIMKQSVPALFFTAQSNHLAASSQSQQPVYHSAALFTEENLLHSKQNSCGRGEILVPWAVFFFDIFYILIIFL